MKRIHRKISLENYRSRYCGLSDSFENGNYISFSWSGKTREDIQELPYENILNVEWPFDIETNYSLLPSDIIFNGSSYTYPTLCDIFQEMKIWRDYNIAKKSNYFISDIDTIDVDEAQNRYDALGKDDMFSILSSVVFPSLEIPPQYVERWGKYRLNIAEAMQWLGYFKECQKENKGNDCCQCEKYNQLCGNEMIEIISNWLREISDLFKITAFQYTHSAFTNVRLSLTCPIDDMGELTPLTEEWDSSENYKNGDVVTHNDEVYCLENEDSQIKLDCHEIVFPNDCGHDDVWITYSSHINNLGIVNDYDDSEEIKSYAYIGDKLILNPNWDNAVTYTTPLYTNGEYGFYYIRNEMHHPILISSITVDESKYYLQKGEGNSVFFVKNKQFLYGLVSDDEFHFTTDSENECEQNFNYPISRNLVVIYKNAYYEVNEIDKTLDIDDGNETYPKIKSYCYDRNGKLLFFNDKNELVSQSLNIHQVVDTNNHMYNKLKWSLVERKDIKPKTENRDWTQTYYYLNNDLCNIYEPLTIYTSNKITGLTESKLSLFRRPFAVDMMGNQLNGAYFSKDKNELALPYKQESIARDIQRDDNEYWFDYLSSITLFVESKLANETLKEMPYSADTSSVTMHFKTMLKSVQNEGNSNQYHIDVNGDKFYFENLDLKAKFVYYMGGNGNINDDKVSGYKGGIMYEETYTLKRETQLYHYNEYSSKTISYYEMINDNVSDTEYGNSVIKTPMANISYGPQMTKDKTFSQDVEFVSSPHFRQDYLLGISSKESVEGDIYIDRGMSQAFDKHLKLMEVQSLEALENYSNGYFKIQ